jgi:xanthine dehydrogenase small subunit
MPRQSIRFLRRGQVVELSSVSPMRTVLDYLRLEEKSKGTKEGCNEGDCGACTVALGSLRDGRVIYEPINACILLVGHLDGKELVTVDDLSDDGVLHPIQQALVDKHASQCGFCTPGFVMTLFTLYHSSKRLERPCVADTIAGNLCRCTGYRPIIDAALESCTGKATDKWARNAEQTSAMLAQLNDGQDVMIGDANGFLAIPASGDSLAALAATHPDATIVSGATDVGLWITKQLRALPKIIHTHKAADLRQIQNGESKISLGAAVTYADAEPFLRGIDPDIGETVRRLGSKQVRASGTVCGNIANGSPIGDMPPILIALGATLHLRRGSALRQMPIENFFTAYGMQDRRPGELVWGVDIPMLKNNEVFRCYKISKRFDQDISAVMGAFKFALSGSYIIDARIAFGGMAATPKRGSGAENALKGSSLEDASSWEAALSALDGDYKPIADMRASAEYRAQTAKALLRKALIEVAGTMSRETRVVGWRERAA